MLFPEHIFAHSGIDPVPVVFVVLEKLDSGVEFYFVPQDFALCALHCVHVISKYDVRRNKAHFYLQFILYLNTKRQGVISITS